MADCFFAMPGAGNRDAQAAALRLWPRDGMLIMAIFAGLSV